MVKKNKINEVIKGKFQKHAHFGFVIPEERDAYGGDFFVTEKNCKDAVTGDKVEARALKNFKGKKPEAKILRIVPKNEPKNKKEIIEGVYGKGNGNFGFIDIEGQMKGYFVYGDKRNGAKDGDKVKAELITFKGKKEAVVQQIIDNDEGVVIGEYKENGEFGFVIPDKNSKSDVFIASNRKNGAKNGDLVEVQIIRTSGKNPEGVIRKILETN